MKFRKNKKGFTLVELVVVIAILAILASVATVATVTVLNNARKTPIEDTLSTLKSQISMYRVDTAYTNQWKTTGTGNNEKKGLAGFLGDNLQDVEIISDASKSYNTQPSGDGLVIWCDTGANLKESSGGASETEFTIYVANKYYKGSITFNANSTTINDIVDW